jgi:hypothetical protein
MMRAAPAPYAARTARHCWQATVGAAALLGAAVAAAATPPAEVTAEIPSARLVGSGLLRYVGFAVYEARLWAAPGFSAPQFAEHPFALELRYVRGFRAASIAERSLAEMRRAGPIAEAQASDWSVALERAIPDVAAGDRLTGVHAPARAVRFFHNGRPSGAVEDAAFAPRFFAIWLAPGTSAPALRSRLIGELP